MVIKVSLQILYESMQGERSGILIYSNEVGAGNVERNIQWNLSFKGLLIKDTSLIRTLPVRVPAT